MVSVVPVVSVTMIDTHIGMKRSITTTVMPRSCDGDGVDSGIARFLGRRRNSRARLRAPIRMARTGRLIE